MWLQFLKMGKKYCYSRRGNDRLLTVAIVVAFIIMIIVAMCMPVRAHDTHFSDVTPSEYPVIAQGWIKEVGYVWGIDTNKDGSPDEFWKLYKDGDLTHRELHIKPLNNDRRKLEVKYDKQEQQSGQSSSD